MKKRILSLLLALVLIVGLLPTIALAEEVGDPATQVRVIVENTTYPVSDGAPWDGTLVDTWVTLTVDSTMMDCVVEALGNYSQTGAEDNYISEINGLKEFDGGFMSGWMGTLNDWFTNEGFGGFTVENGKLSAGDEIRIMYTCNGYGADLGGSWGNSDKTVKALSFSAGTLAPEFDKDTHAYTLTVPAGTTGVVVTPTASNKNYQVRTSVGGTEYKRTVTVPVADGTEITVKCGDPSWPSMNGNSGEAQVYTITVKLEQSDTPVVSTAWDGETKTEPAQENGVYQIGTGAELAWFVAKYEEKVDVSGILTADIDLGNYPWVATITGGNAKSIILDGAGHSVTGLNSNRGLLGAVSGASHIKDLTVSGKVEANSTIKVAGTPVYRVGGLAGYLGGGIIEDCVVDVEITTTNTSASSNLYVGGIAGQVGGNVTIRNCANYGKLNLTGCYAGGIVGYSNSTFSVIGCCNAGEIIASRYVGGIVGGNESKPITITGCYNSGRISGTKDVGGLVGYATAGNKKNPSKITDCYTTGIVTGTEFANPLFGRAFTSDSPLVSVANLFFLDTLGTDSNGIAKTDAQLKACEGLNRDYFKSSCGGYPVLLWQTASAHTPNGDGTVTSPTCEVGGYTTYVCSTCGFSYEDDRTEALNHQFCEHNTSTTCAHCKAEDGKLVRTCMRDGCEATTTVSIIPYYTVTLPTGQSGYNVETVEGSASPVAEGGSFRFTVTLKANYEKGEDFVVKANGIELTANENGIYTIGNIAEDQTVTVNGVVKIPEISITVPKDAQVELNYKSSSSVSYYYQTALSALSVEKTVENADDTVTYYYTPKKNIGHIYRVTAEDGVTYVGFFTKRNNVRVDLTVTDSQLHPEGKTPKTLDRVLTSNSGCNVADVFLNINEKGYLTMDEGSTRQLYSLRSWQAIKDGSYMSNAFVEPDYHYTVIDENGQTSNSVVTVSADGLLTAVGSGTAIVLVTYDAMTYEFSSGDEFFGAIWPENTGVFVVSVGAGDSGIVTGMTMNTEDGKNYNNSKLAGDALDAEMDVIYFLGDSGSYTFTPGTADVIVSVANPTVNDVMTFTGFETVSSNSDGSYSVPLMEGRNIVKLEKDGKAEYQVITAKPVTITVNNGETVKPGDDLTITFSTIYHPANKLGGIYNGTAGAVYTAPDGTLVGSITGGSIGVYNIASSATAQTITSAVVRKEAPSAFGTMDVTYSFGDKLSVPADYTESTYTLSGGAVIAVSNAYCMKFGAHRTINGNADAVSTQATLASREAYFGVLPDIVIEIDQTEALVAAVEELIDAIGDDVTLASRDAIEAAREAYDALSDGQKALVTNYQKLLDAEEAYNALLLPIVPGKLDFGTAVETKPTTGFSDVSADDWFYDAVQYASNNGLMNGTGNGLFSPHANTTRGMIVTILARLEGVDTSKGGNWYEAGQKWAMENGISDGTGMDGQITREQLATMLYRYAQLKGRDTTARADLSTFADAGSVSGWAQEAMQWAVAKGLIQGSNNQLTPTAPATRAQVATILMRFIG